VIGKRNRELIRLKRMEIQRKSTTENPDRVYFCWFLSLKLILEMEDLGLGNRVIGKYKIDREFYKEWNLDALLHLSFYKWWEMHQALFESYFLTNLFWKREIGEWLFPGHARW